MKLPVGTQSVERYIEKNGESPNRETEQIIRAKLLKEARRTIPQSSFRTVLAPFAAALAY